MEDLCEAFLVWLDSGDREYRRISDEEVAQAVADANEKIEELLQVYDEGLITYREAVSHLKNSVYYEKYYRFMMMHGLRFRVNDYDGFQEEFRSWKEDGAIDPASRENCEVYFSRDYFPIYEESLDVTAEEKAHMFQMIDGMDFPPDMFEPEDPVPDGAVVPHKAQAASYLGNRDLIVMFECADDGGFFDSANAYGSTFKLTDDRGLHAVLRVLSPEEVDEDFYVKAKKFRGTKGYDTVEYVAEGYIEGYTEPSMKHLIYVEITGRNRMLFYFTISDSELNQWHYQNRLWKKYHMWVGRHIRRFETACFKWVSRLLGIPDGKMVWLQKE